MLRFQFEDQVYEIGFRRFHKKVVSHDKPFVAGFLGALGAAAVNMVDSKFPSTEATITKVGEGLKKNWEVVNHATADCFHQDKFTLEKGRLAALRKVSDQLNVGMRKAMWDCYQGRKG